MTGPALEQPMSSGRSSAARDGLSRLVGMLRGRVQQVQSTLHRSAEQPEWSLPPVRRPARPEVRMAVAVGPRLASGLALEVTTTELTAGGWPSGSDVDLVLVELRDGAPVVPLPAVPADPAAPLVLWATSGGPSSTVQPLVTAAAAVFVADAGQLDRWREVAPSAQPLPPGATTRQQPRAGDRDGVVMHVDAPVPPSLIGTVVTVVNKALVPLQDRLVVHRTDERTPLPRVLADAAVATDPVKVADAVATAAVVVDGARSSAGDTWTALAAAAAQSAVVTPAGWPAPGGMQLPGGATAGEFRSTVVARLEQPELRDREARRLHRALVAGHGLDQRVAELLAAVGVPATASDTSVSAVVPTRRTHELDNVLTNIGRQSHRDTELVLVLHGLELDERELRARAEDAGVPRLTVVHADPRLTLGACMNLGVDAAEGAWVAKMDDDNYYGTHYLTDLVAAATTSAAPIVGKWAHYVWLRSTDTVVLRHADTEHTYQRRIQGGSMLFAGDLVRDLRFSDIPRAVDSDILDRAIAEGVKIWSADRFNFVSVRGDDRTSHTWTVADDVFLTAAGRLAFFGDPRPHVEV
jgi:hypothetical protein